MIHPNVVVIDKSVDVQDRVDAFFRTKGFYVEKFCEHKAALESFAAQGSFWDVILTDMDLDEASEQVFLTEISKLRPDLKVISISVPEVDLVPLGEKNKELDTNEIKVIRFPDLLGIVERVLKPVHSGPQLLEVRTKDKTILVGPPDIIGSSPIFLAALAIAKKIARSEANVFLSGETGSGKEVFAKYIHGSSTRSKGAFVAINCSAIPENLLESELFGHAKGSFTGAHDKKIGLFEEAQDGTIFLDEIGDLSLALQAKLLRVLQEKKIRRVGENQSRNINARIISATHKNIATQITDGFFREDLFYRLCVIPIAIPPLRERIEDILPLAESFLLRFAKKNNSLAKVFTQGARSYLLHNLWRGNIRELENVVERAVVLSEGPEIGESAFAPSLLGVIESLQQTEANANEEQFVLECSGHLPTLDEAIQKYIEFAVSFNGGAKDRTAKDIGIDRKTLYKKLKHEIM